MSGRANGTYTPFANTDCGTVEDPYQYRRVPAPGDCVDQATLDASVNHWRAEVFQDYSYQDFSNGPEGETIDVVGGVTLQPGTYCDGLTLNAKRVTFAPGEYIMKDGPLHFGNGTWAFGEDVTFIFAGKDAVLSLSLIHI